MERGNRVKAELEKGIRGGVFPGAVLLVAQGGEISLFEEAGQCSLGPGAPSIHKDTIFDLASLTKPLATTLAMMKLVDEGDVYLDQPLSELLSGDIPEDKATLTPQQLLSHCGGFADWKPFYLELCDFSPEQRKDLLRKRLLHMPLVYQPGKGTLYSDLGFMMLEWIAEKRLGIPLALFIDQQFYRPLSLKSIFFSSQALPDRFEEDQFAATEFCPWRKRTVVGYVHDENAYALGGYSGHSGLFGVAKEVYALVGRLRTLYRGETEDYLKPETVRTFFARQDLVKGSTWALGWDTPSLENSSSGKHFSRNSVGHLGYTGTSIWMDLDQDVIVVFLTNRIHPTRKNDKIKAFRPGFHDLIMKELGVA
jgi:CubicO group peptidase (beta-lactamase class C family)